MLFFYVLLLSALAHASKVNPLPAPRSLVWGSTGTAVAIEIESFATPNITGDGVANLEIVYRAFDRIYERIASLKWEPATLEVASYFETYPIKESSNATYAEKYTGLTTPEFGSKINNLNIYIADLDADLQMSVDESYNMSLGESLVITAQTAWGALHGLETLAQMVIFDKEMSVHYIEDTFELTDAPLYPHRGLLVDTARNFMTVDSLLEQIDLLAMAKMNVFHWHIVETQSWPIEILKYPSMTDDAYSPDEIYTQDVVRDIVQYGKDRGVRVIPEIDLPGHSSSGWTTIDPELVPCHNAFWCQSDKFQASVEPNPGQLDILYNRTYEVVKDVYDELSGLFDDNLFHVGADEMTAACYNYSTYINGWFAANESRTHRDLIQYWVDKAYPMFLKDKPDRRLIMWEDIVTSEISAYDLPKETIMQVWTQGPKHIKQLTSMGHDVIVSTSDYLYLDCGEASWLPNDPNYIDGYVGWPDTYNYNPGYGSSWCGPYKTFQRIYNYDIAANLTEEEASHIIGGETAIWSEQTDSNTLTSMVWPRASAYGENLWSGNRDDSGERRTAYFTQRILNFREYIVALGYRAKALVPKYCLQHPHACDHHWDKTFTLDA